MHGMPLARLVCLAGALALSACTLRIHVPYEEGRQELVYTPPRVANAAFQYEDPPPLVTEQPADIELRHYEVSRWAYPSAGRNGQKDNQVDALFFQGQQPGPKKTIIVLPIWGSHTYPPEKITYGYARRAAGDTNMVWVQGEVGLFEWDRLAATTEEEEFVRMATEMRERWLVSVIDIRRLLDYLEKRPDVDPARIGIAGFSMGALVAATVLGNDYRISAGVLMMGGARFGDIFANCAGRVAAVRDNAMERFGWSLEQYREFLTELFWVAEPTRYAGHYNPEQILMIDAYFDDCAPKSSREALWEALGYPERYTFMYKHKKAFYSMTPLGFNYTRHRIYEFFDRVL